LELIATESSCRDFALSYSQRGGDRFLLVAKLVERMASRCACLVVTCAKALDGLLEDCDRHRAEVAVRPPLLASEAVEATPDSLADTPRSDPCSCLRGQLTVMPLSMV
jgi:hypothetical protein